MSVEIINALDYKVPAMRNGFVISTFDGAFHIEAKEAQAFIDLAKQTLMHRLVPAANEPFSKTFNTERGQIVALLLPAENEGNPTVQVFLQPGNKIALQKVEMHFPKDELGWKLGKLFLGKMDATMALLLCKPLLEKAGGLQ